MGGCGSDDRAKSVNIDGTVIAEGLIFGLLAGEQVENGGKGLLAYLLDALFAGDDTAGVDIHIVRHPLVGVGVAAHFQDGHGRKALRRAAAGGEHHKLCTGGGHAGQDLRLAARCVLDPESLALADGLGVLHDALNGTGAAFYDGTKAFFLDGGQTALDVARGGLALAHIAAETSGTRFHPVYDLINFVAYFRIDRTAGQQMLAAQKLRRLAKHDRRTEIHQLVGHIAHDAVGGHAGGGVRSAAFDGHGDVVDADRLALDTADEHYQLLRGIDTGLDGGADTAQFLNADDADGFPRLADLSGQPLVVGALAAEAHHQDRCHIGAFAQRDERFGDTVEVRRKLAAALVVEVAHCPGYLPHDGRGHVSGTGHAGHDGHMVPTSDLSIRADISHKFIRHDNFPPVLAGRPGRAGCRGSGYGHDRLF